MSNKIDELKKKTEFTFNVAADFFDNPVLAYRNYFGTKTINNLRLSAGFNVLDAGCGAGAATFPAARAVGREGRVIGIDISDNLLVQAKRKAQKEGFKNIEFINMDMTKLDFEENMSEAVVAVLSIYFVDDMAKQIKDLFSLVKPNGKLAVTTWGPRIFEPFYSFWNNEVKRIRPDLYSSFNPWERIFTPDCVRNLLEDAGCTNVISLFEEKKQQIESPEDFWTLVLGSGFRWVVEQLTPDEKTEVNDNIINWATINNIKSIETNAIFAIARKE